MGETAGSLGGGNKVRKVKTNKNARTRKKAKKRGKQSSKATEREQARLVAGMLIQVLPVCQQIPYRHRSEQEEL